jgi:hypothetical protein
MMLWKEYSRMAASLTNGTTTSGVWIDSQAHRVLTTGTATLACDMT